jgi:hypothetical protein
MFLISGNFSSVLSLSARNQPQHSDMTRQGFFWKMKVCLLSAGALSVDPTAAFAITNGITSASPSLAKVSTKTAQISYRSISLPIPNLDISVPVACWYPADDQISVTTSQTVQYQHRISVKRIGELLAGWDFIPEFASRDFALNPTTTSKVLDGKDIPFPNAAKVVILAHGYLGSRFDLSHLGEELAQQGFVCVSPEYPESLAASYPRREGMDRSAINQALLQRLQQDMKPKSYGIVGHSLGCGTALRTGDASWTRVLIAGRAPPVDNSPLLFVSSVNDGAVKFGGPLTVPTGYTLLKESNLPSSLPTRSALVFDRPDAPNHISYLSEGVNNAMINLLSPLLPVAQALSIPVLDFDRYKISQDSVPTAAILMPLISSYLLQHMGKGSRD